MNRRGNNLTIYPQKKSLSTESRSYGYIQTSTRTKDGEGGYTTTWGNAHPSPHAMAVLPLTAIQLLNYDSVNVEATHLVKIRGEIVITELNRIFTVDNIIYEVLNIRDVQDRGIVKWVLCKERRE